MRFTDVVDLAMVMDRVSRAELARRVGWSTHSAVTNALNRKQGMSIGTFIRMMNAMGYEIVARREDGEFVVTEE